jgi:hypothetical protein
LNSFMDRFEELAATTRQLQEARRLPSDAELYHPALELLRQHLLADDPEQAEAEARDITKNDRARGYVAFEHLKIHYLSLPEPDRERASHAAKRAADCLARYERERERLRSGQRSWWRR